MYKMYVKVCMSHAYFSSSELLIFLNDASKKIDSNQQIGGDGAVCHNLNLSSISLTLSEQERRRLRTDAMLTILID